MRRCIQSSVFGGTLRNAAGETHAAASKRGYGSGIHRFTSLRTPRLASNTFGNALGVTGQFRWQASRADKQIANAATKEVPRTPDGQNPYDVFDIVPTEETTMEELAKHFKKLAVKFHPDREGGSHDKMAEVNSAFQIIKQWHPHVLTNIQRVKADGTGTDNEHVGPSSAGRYRTKDSERAEREREMGRTGGLRQNVRHMNKQKSRSPAEIAAKWEEYREEKAVSANRMIGRFEVALQHGVFFRKSQTLTEITVRERWLRKQFIKGVWEDVHEMRTELLRRGARNLQMSQLAEEMVAFATQTQEKLDSDFRRQAQQMYQEYVRFNLQKWLNIIAICTSLSWFFYKLFTGLYYNSMTVRTKEAMTGVAGPAY